MKKPVFYLLIVLLAACSNKETPPESVDDVQEEIVERIVVTPKLQNMAFTIEIPELQIQEKEETGSAAFQEMKMRDKEEFFEKAEEPYSYYTSMPLLHPYYILGVQASSELTDSQGRYPAGNLIDCTWQSWAEGSQGDGAGESFTFYFSDRMLDREKNIAGFALKNGYGNLDYYGQNNRVKAFNVYVDGNYIETIPIKDSISFEQYAFTQPVSGGTIHFVIDDIYPGTKYNDTCVAEIALLEWTVDDNDFYGNILFWISTSTIFAPGADTQYENHAQQTTSISDPDRVRFMDYLPFDISFENRTYKTNVVLLDGQSSLKLNDRLPRLDGATAMYPLYSSFVHAVYPEIEFKFDPRRSTIVNALFEWVYFPNGKTMQEIFFWERAPNEIGSIVQCNTTSTAYERLIDGKTDIIFCYEPSDAEKRLAAERGKAFNLTPIAKDAFVFIVNEKNTLNNITQQQIRDIYSGRVTNWKTISGADEPVIAYQRPENSGSQTILQSVMRGDSLIRPILDGEFIPADMGSMILKVASNYYNYNSAIGYSFLFYLAQMAGTSGTKVLAVDGVAPTRQTIQSNAYPFVQTVYAVTTGNESENTKRFIEWILSAQGQELVEKTGYIPVSR